MRAAPALVLMIALTAAGAGCADRASDAGPSSGSREAPAYPGDDPTEGRSHQPSPPATEPSDRSTDQPRGASSATTRCSDVRLPAGGLGEADVATDRWAGTVRISFSDTRRGRYRNVSYTVAPLDDPTCRTDREMRQVLTRVWPRLTRDADRNSERIRRPGFGTCSLAQPWEAGPVVPRREEVTDVVACLDGNSPTVQGFDPAARELLRRRWSRATPVPRSQRATCVDPRDQRIGYLIVNTDDGDLVALTRSPCGFLAFESSDVSAFLAVPVTFGELDIADDIRRMTRPPSG